MKNRLKRFLNAVGFYFTDLVDRLTGKSVIETIIVPSSDLSFNHLCKVNGKWRQYKITLPVMMMSPNMSIIEHVKDSLKRWDNQGNVRVKIIKDPEYIKSVVNNYINDQRSKNGPSKEKR